MNPQRRLGLVATGGLVTTGAPGCVAQSASLRRVHEIFGKGQGEARPRVQSAGLLPGAGKTFLKLVQGDLF